MVPSGYNASMSSRTREYMEAIEHLPEGATLILHESNWSEYERLLEDLISRPRLRVTYNRGKLEIMSPLSEHENYARFIDDLVRSFAIRFSIKLEKFGGATWKKQQLDQGVEPDSCYYVTNADRIIGKRRIDLEVDPPPDIAVEIDITNESLSKFSIYAGLGVPEIWRYDGKKLEFYGLFVESYRLVPVSRILPGLTPAVLAAALEKSRTEGQTVALEHFRQQLG